MTKCVLMPNTRALIRLTRRRSNDDRLAMFPRSGHERVQAGRVNAVVIRDQKFHRGRNYYVAEPVATSRTLPLEPVVRWAVDFVETRRSPELAIRLCCPSREMPGLLSA